jgi:hypothetical protein
MDTELPFRFPKFEYGRPELFSCQTGLDIEPDPRPENKKKVKERH